MNSSEVVGTRDTLAEGTQWGKEGLDAGPLWEGPPAGTESARRWEEIEQGLLEGVSRVFENSPEGSLA